MKYNNVATRAITIWIVSYIWIEIDLVNLQYIIVRFSAESLLESSSISALTEISKYKRRSFILHITILHFHNPVKHIPIYYVIPEQCDNRQKREKSKKEYTDAFTISDFINRAVECAPVYPLAVCQFGRAQRIIREFSLNRDAFSRFFKLKLTTGGSKYKIVNIWLALTTREDGLSLSAITRDTLCVMIPPRRAEIRRA